jgi:CDP-diacylglycerol--glycerol-3-phosphate 3-phosphatidyltransferase
MTITPQQKPDLGLYQAKYWLRDQLRHIPGIGSLSPNVLSLLAFIPGGVAACCLWQDWWLGAAVAIATRMVINTLDGLVAEEFNKTSALGAYLNRLPGEFTDVLIVLGLWHLGEFPWTLALVVLVGWVQMFGLLGLVAGSSIQSVGPCGQTDRLAILAIAALVAIVIDPVKVWHYVIPGLCVGCSITILLRIYRTIRSILQQTASSEVAPSEQP